MLVILTGEPGCFLFAVSTLVVAGRMEESGLLISFGIGSGLAHLTAEIDLSYNSQSLRNKYILIYI